MPPTRTHGLRRTRAVKLDYDAPLFEDKAQAARLVVNVKSGDPYDVYIGRANPAHGLPASKWANPFKLEREADRAAVLAQYRAWLMQQPELLAALPELRGKRLGCWCAPKACHGDILAELANAPAYRRQCPICGLLKPLAGRMCAECYDAAPALLSSQHSALQGIEAKIDAARADYSAALEAMTETERTRYAAMDALRGAIGFDKRYEATSKAQDGLGRVVRAEMALAALEPSARLVMSLREKIALLEDAVMLREESDAARREG